MHANSINTINIMFSSMFKIKQESTVQTNCIILFLKCFGIPSFCMYICVQAIGNSSKQFFLYALFAETFGTCAHHRGEETWIPSYFFQKSLIKLCN